MVVWKMGEEEMELNEEILVVVGKLKKEGEELEIGEEGEEIGEKG